MLKEDVEYDMIVYCPETKEYGKVEHVSISITDNNIGCCWNTDKEQALHLKGTRGLKLADILIPATAIKITNWKERIGK